jgi:hypothetical protein
MIGEQLVADVMEVADDGRGHTLLEQSLLDVRYRGRRLVAVDRHTNEF